MAEPIEMPFWGLTHVGVRNHALGLDWGRGWTNPFAESIRVGDAAFRQNSLTTL